MTERQKQVTQLLFWCAFGVFLAVSIPHVAWVVDQYEPHGSNPLVSLFYGVLALGYAVAIDGIMAWLTHVQSSSTGQGRSPWDQGVTWIFIVALVVMSWYLNWVYNLAHDPSGQSGDVWRYTLTNQFGLIPVITVGSFTPILLAALPVFTIAYVSILNKVNAMKAQNAKSVEELEREASEVERRTVAVARIRNAGKTEDTTGKVVTNMFGLAKRVRSEAKDLTGEKKDRYAVMLEKVLAFFNETPDLLQNEAQANVVIKDLLKLKNLQMAEVWRVKAIQKLARMQAEKDAQRDLQKSNEEKDTDPGLPTVLDEENTPLNDLQNGEQNGSQTLTLLDLSEDVLEVVKRYPKIAALVLSGDSTASVEAISEATGYGVKRLKNRVQGGAIRHTPRNENIVFIDSVLQWLKTAPLLRQSESQTARLSAVKLDEVEVQTGGQTDSYPPLVTEDLNDLVTA